MSEQAKGVVKFLEQNKGGFWAFKLGNDKTRYNTGSKDEPSFSNGQLVEFSFYLKNDQYPTVKGDVKVLKKSAGGGSSSAGRSSGGGGNRDGYWEQKAAREIAVVEPRISYLAAVERATQIVALAIAQEAYPSLAKAKDKLAQIRAYIAAEAEVIFNQAYAAKVPAAPAANDDSADEGDEEGDEGSAEESDENWEE